MSHAQLRLGQMAEEPVPSDDRARMFPHLMGRRIESRRLRQLYRLICMVSPPHYQAHTLADIPNPASPSALFTRRYCIFAHGPRQGRNVQQTMRCWRLAW